MKFIENIKRIYEYGKELEIYLDMDRTIIELIFDIEESFTQKGNYIKKVPIKPVINQLEKIHRLYPNINKENRIFLSEESHEYGKIDINKIKGEYIKANITEDKIAILIDDDVRILNETKKF